MKWFNLADLFCAGMLALLATPAGAGVAPITEQEAYAATSE
jgi:hypothetical protein